MILAILLVIVGMSTLAWVVLLYVAWMVDCSENDNEFPN